MLDEVAKAWKRNSGGVILDDSPDKKLVNTLKQLETCMSGGRVDAARLLRNDSGVGGNVTRSHPPLTSREESQVSLDLSGLDVEDNSPRNMSNEEDSILRQDARPYLKVISAFTQPRLTYSTVKKSLEMITSPPSLFPPPSHKTALFRNRYNLVHQRLMRHESFQAASFPTIVKSSRLLQRTVSSMTTVQQAYKITPVSNLLGRSGSSHLLLGLLAIAPTTGELALSDLTGSITLDLSSARPVPEDGAWFCPGMIVLIEGIYEEDGSNAGGGVGGMVGGRFFGSSIGGPPAERRDMTLGITGSSNDGSASVLSAGAGFGWIDFLGVGGERAHGKAMRRVQQKILGNRRDDDDDQRRTKIALLGECQLDSPRTLEAIRKILSTYSLADSLEETPLAIVFMGNFVSKAVMAGADSGPGSIEYKEHLNALASVLSEFPSILSSTTLIFVPGDNDPWPSAFSAGAASPLPRDKVPDIFTLRIRRAVNNANVEAGKVKGTGEAIWTSNPARISLFGPVEDIVLFRDDITGRLRRSAMTFERPAEDENDEDVRMGGSTDEAPPTANHSSSNQNHHQHRHEATQLDPSIHEAESHLPSNPDQSCQQQQSPHRAFDVSARKLIKTLLDQSHLSPFPLSTRPILWDYASTLHLYPLPTALMLTDAEVAAFAITYEGCHVMNAGRVLDELGAEGRKGGVAKWVEYDVKKKRGEVKNVRF